MLDTMMKIMGASLIVAGTSIGGGMLALPIVLAKFGIFYSLILIISLFLLVNFCSLVNVELYFKINKIATLGTVSNIIGGKSYAFIGHFCIFLLSFSLTSAYINGLGSTIYSLLVELGYTTVKEGIIMLLVTIILSFLIVSPITKLDKVNRFLFSSLFFLIIFLSCRFFLNSSFTTNFLITNQKFNFNEFLLAASVLMTSFGFQIILPTISKLCNFDKSKIINSIIIGSSITLGIYLLWVISTIGLISSSDPKSYDLLQSGKMNLGDFLLIISNLSNLIYFKTIIISLTFLAILTSALGISLAQIQFIKSIFKQDEFGKTSILQAIIILLPSSIVAIYVPNLFIKALGFAGIILVIKVIILPITLLLKSGKGEYINICYKPYLLYPAYLIGIFWIIFASLSI